MMSSDVQHRPLLVILAEDEALVRMLALETLMGAGCEVIEARHAEEALVALRERAAQVHVLFTDIHMPGAMDGLALAHHARDHWPWIGLLICSGEARPGRSEMPANSRFLSKPYHPDVLLSHVRELAALG